jgi:hypothetical protein
MPEFDRAFSAKLDRFPGVVSGPSRLGNKAHRAWFAEGKEFAHLHASNLVDLRVPRSVQRAVKDEPAVILRDHPSEWMEVQLDSEADVKLAVELAHHGWRDARLQARKGRKPGGARAVGRLGKAARDPKSRRRSGSGR